jgi:hypothetical protein
LSVGLMNLSVIGNILSETADNLSKPVNNLSEFPYILTVRQNTTLFVRYFLLFNNTIRLLKLHFLLVLKIFIFFKSNDTSNPLVFWYIKEG